VAKLEKGAEETVPERMEKRHGIRPGVRSHARVGTDCAELIDWGLACLAPMQVNW